MNILYVMQGLKYSSGPTQAIYNLSKNVADLGHSVSLAYISGRGTDPEQEFPENVQLISFPAKGFKKFSYAPSLKTFLKQRGKSFDIIHVTGIWAYPNLVIKKIAKKKGIPFIIRPAGSLEPWPMRHKSWKKNVYLNWIEKKNINSAQAIHATSSQEAINLASFKFKPEIFTIPNGINTNEFSVDNNKSDLREKLGLPKDKFILLFLSRIHPKKNLEFLGNVFQNLHERYPDLFLLIVGPDDHEYADQVKQYYRELNIFENSHFYGEAAGRKKMDIYNAADLFVLPTYSENFGIVVLEALSAGLPVVVSNQTPWQEVITKKAGFWLPLNEEDFEKALEYLYQNKDKYEELSNNAKNIAEKYDWKSISKAMVNKYKEIINKT